MKMEGLEGQGCVNRWRRFLPALPPAPKIIISYVPTYLVSSKSKREPVKGARNMEAKTDAAPTMA